MITSAARVAELRATAEQATPGPWKADVSDPGDCVVWGPEHPDQLLGNVGGQRIQATHVVFDADAKNAAHIAAFDPPTVLALLDDLDEARRQAHAVAEQIDAFLTAQHAPPIWWRVSDIAHTGAGCVWDDEAGVDGAYDCEIAALEGTKETSDE